MGRSRAVATVASALLVLGLAAQAQAQPCVGLVDAGPLVTGPGPADFGQVPEACGRTDFFLRPHGELTVDSPGFYGAVTGGATLRGRLQLTERWFVSAAIDPATWYYSVNAVVSSSTVGAGPATLAVHRTFSFGWKRTVLTPYARLLLPLDTARHYGERWGGELGASASRRLGARFALRGGLAFPATLVSIGGVGKPAVLPAALAEVVYGPRWWLAFAAGPAGRMRLAPSPALLAVAARASARAMTRRGWHFGLAADVPVAGTDRTDLTAAIFVGWSRSDDSRLRM